MATSNGLVSFAFSTDILRAAELNPRYKGRGVLVSSLIEAYGLFNHIRIVSPVPAGMKELTSFHSQEYIKYLQREDDQSDEYGLGYDCPVFSQLFNYVSWITGTSITLANTLVTGENQLAINWYGGWHHAQRDEASGFCYCNDVVIAILHLLKRFHKVLYIDLDIHHGDGVQNAFYYSSQVFTLSLHKYSPGFYPGTGSVDETGRGSGQYHCINVPLIDGITDEMYTYIFKRIVNEIYDVYIPEVIVVQCGADCLAGDPLGTFNLTLQGIGDCINEIIKWDLPTLLLGGGGYDFANTARCWTYLTALLVKETLASDIPEHEYFISYGPSYQLEVEMTNRKNEMTQEMMTKLLHDISQNIQQLQNLT